MDQRGHIKLRTGSTVSNLNHPCLTRMIQVLHLEDLKEGRIVLSAPKFNAGVSGSKATPKALAEVRVNGICFHDVWRGYGCWVEKRSTRARDELMAAHLI